MNLRPQQLRVRMRISVGDVGEEVMVFRLLVGWVVGEGETVWLTRSGDILSVR